MGSIRGQREAGLWVRSLVFFLDMYVRTSYSFIYTSNVISSVFSCLLNIMFVYMEKKQHHVL